METVFGEKDYREWLRNRTSEEYVISEDEESVVFTAGDYTASAVFHEEAIVELMITDAQQENRFYLHFRLNTKEHAEELALEMLSTLVKLKNRKSVNVLLTCTSALTTSYFASLLNDAAELLKLDYHFDAVPFSKLYSSAESYAAVLLAPQVSFQYDKVKNILTDQIVMKVPGSVFGTYNTGELLDLLKENLAHKNSNTETDDNFILKADEANRYRILVLAFITDHDGSRCAYRIYDHGRKTLDKEVIKSSISMHDIDDLMDYISVRHKNIDMIGIAIPGIAYKGNLTHKPFGFDHTNLA